MSSFEVIDQIIASKNMRRWLIVTSQYRLLSREKGILEENHENANEGARCISYYLEFTIEVLWNYV